MQRQSSRMVGSVEKESLVICDY